MDFFAEFHPEALRSLSAYAFESRAMGNSIDEIVAIGSYQKRLISAQLILSLILFCPSANTPDISTVYDTMFTQQIARTDYDQRFAGVVPFIIEKVAQKNPDTPGIADVSDI
jgi:hypothetical protein